MCVRIQVDFWRSTGPAYGENGTDYATFLYTREILKIINEHDIAVPLFVYMAYQNVHGPTQVPSNFTDMYVLLSTLLVLFYLLFCVEIPKLDHMEVLPWNVANIGKDVA